MEKETDIQEMRDQARSGLSQLRLGVNRIEKALSAEYYNPLLIINPTGKGIRNDSKGSGEFTSKRGSRVHSGKDYLCDPGQDIVSPITGRFQRTYLVYPKEKWKGMEIVGEDKICRLHYVWANVNLARGMEITAGQVIGRAADISEKYGPKMEPHVHLDTFIRVKEVSVYE